MVFGIWYFSILYLFAFWCGEKIYSLGDKFCVFVYLLGQGALGCDATVLRELRSNGGSVFVCSVAVRTYDLEPGPHAVVCGLSVLNDLIIKCDYFCHLTERSWFRPPDFAKTLIPSKRSQRPRVLFVSDPEDDYMRRDAEEIYRVMFGLGSWNQMDTDILVTERGFGALSQVTQTHNNDVNQVLNRFLVQPFEGLGTIYVTGPSTEQTLGTLDSEVIRSRTKWIELEKIKSNLNSYDTVLLF